MTAPTRAALAERLDNASRAVLAAPNGEAMTAAVKNLIDLACAAAEALTPCPFCGGTARYVTIPNSETDVNGGGEYVECSVCECCTRLWFPLKESVQRQVVAAWNRRMLREPEPQGIDRPNYPFGGKLPLELTAPDNASLAKRLREITDDTSQMVYLTSADRATVRHAADALDAEPQGIDREALARALRGEVGCASASPCRSDERPCDACQSRTARILARLEADRG